MRRHLLAISASARALAIVPTLALGAQGNGAGAEAGAANAVTSAQSGGGSQTATNTQVLPIAAAPAVAAQVVPVNLNLPISVASSGGGGNVDQSNTAGADASAANTVASTQKGGGGGSQTATNTQVAPIAAAPAVAAQVVPVNANVPVTVLGDAPSGDVDQSNRAYAGADASNTVASRQEGAKGGTKDEGGDQTATNTQVAPVALAPAIAAQVVPVNANVPVNLFTTGDEGDGKGDPKADGVDQSNVAVAGASAGNLVASAQKGGGSQTATNTQVTPLALAPALAPQILPVNANVPVTVGNPLALLPALPIDPFAVLADPVGTVTGLVPPLPVDPFAILGDPVGTVTGLLPLGAVTGLLPALPALPALPVGLPSGLV